MDYTQVKIHPAWREALKAEFESPYFDNIVDTLKAKRSQGVTIYPPGPLIFNAYNKVPPEEVKVVILGQDPYHNPGEAMGLSFSVPQGVRIPPSLKNIYKEIADDLNLKIPTHGDLSSWADQGVFLLNAILTVEKNSAASHRHLGWQNFTDATIRYLSEHRDNIVFMLWGNFAKQKKDLIDNQRHLALEAFHPSPLAGNRFSGCKHFSKANQYLTTYGKKSIDWQIL